MKTRGRLAGLALVVFLAPSLALTAAFLSSFERNLTVGSAGPDVKALQELLNKNPITRLAESGPGSLGQETTYFGPLTRAAVKKYQELHFDEILKPIGLSEGTGFVGPLTRAVLNRELAANSVGSAVSPIPSSGAPAFSRPVISSISPASGKTGTKVTINGSGFTSANAIYTGFEVFRNVGSNDGKTLEVTINSNVPAEALQYVPDLPVYIYVTNTAGRSDEIKFTLITE